MEVLTTKIAARHQDGTIGSATVECTESALTDEVRLMIDLNSGQRIEMSSEVGVFDALRKARRELEKCGVTLLCYGCDERVYPSPMQQAMGINALAYRNELGKQATSSDIVEIFGADDSLNCVTVDEQEDFHRKWLESL